MNAESKLVGIHKSAESKPKLIEVESDDSKDTKPQFFHPADDEMLSLPKQKIQKNTMVNRNMLIQQVANAKAQLSYEV